MAKASILVMVRPMLADRKGFTLVEMIFVLAITVIISSITLAFRKPKASAQAQIALVTHAFQLARSQAMVKHETVKVVCDSNSIITSLHLMLPDISRLLKQSDLARREKSMNLFFS